MKYLAILLVLAGCGGQQTAIQTPAPQGALPHILMVGDYNSEREMPYLKDYLQGEAVVTHAEVPGQLLKGDASTTVELQHMPEWLAADHYKFVHLDAITDIDHCHPYQNDVETYTENLGKMIALIRAAGATPIFATSTPSNLPIGCHPEDLVVQYNMAAVALMNQLGVQIDDQYAVISPYPEYMTVGVFLSDTGYEVLAMDTASSFGYLPR